MYYVDYNASYYMAIRSNLWRLEKMNCWNCNTELIWGGDHDTEDTEDYDIVSNLSCPKCHTAVDVWHPSEKLIKEYEDYEKKKK